MSETIASELADLQARVTAQTSVNQSAVTLLQGLSALLQTAISNAGLTPDQASAFDQVKAQMDSNSSALSAAVVANTPAASGGTEPPPADTTAPPADTSTTTTP